ncbi:MAG: GyrI-like domain-containing protein [Anaerolineales bacterium]|nr:GyrI-like domain-containing protein [Anaerolineales bacterium]
MEPKMVEKDSMILVGFSFFGDPFMMSGGWTEENEIGRLWNRFIAFFFKHRNEIKHTVSNTVMYEVHIQYEVTKSTGELEVFTGVEVAKLEDVPIEMLVKILPPSTYAVFTLYGQEISSDWQKMIQGWMKESGYSPRGNFGLQCYDERFKGLDRIDESILDIMVPVKR